ncbi:MAG: HAD-IB family hydrolase [Myxococcales bacterium]|nr:HAD-IB family hydrolase [Myxococcales bacterium]MDD9966957.1 HAD-IB family hydrolase [Myxococcales bacterium]
MNLALFDFDGTITTRDTFVDFIEFAVSPRRLLLGKLALAPLIAGYRLGRVRATTIRTAISRVAFAGTEPGSLCERGRRFAEERIPVLLRDRAMRRLDWHREQGDRIVVVSASLDLYLRHWCKAQAVELICTEIEVDGTKVTGRYVGGDCTGAMKRRRILERYELDSYPVVYAYGDTDEDREMLDLADKPFFRWREGIDG